MVETNGEMEERSYMPNVPTSTSAMTTGKLFDIDYSKVWNRHEFPNKHLAAQCLM